MNNPYLNPRTFVMRCAARNLSQTRNSYDDPEAERVARWKVAEWLLDTIPSDLERWFQANADPEYARDIHTKITRLIERRRISKEAA